MVSWSELTGAIQKNTHGTFNVPLILLQTDRSTIPNVSLNVNVDVAVKKDPEINKSCLKSDLPAQVAVAVEAPVTDDAVAVTGRPSNTITISDTQPVKAVIAVKLPIKESVKEHTGIPRVSKTVVDPVVIGIEQSEPLYNSAPRLTKHQMEIVEAQRLEAMMNEVYSKESGRSRGWTKVGLDQMLKARCASGGNIKELERARVSFPWKLIRDDKLASAFLDFVCVCKQIRVAVWDTDAKIAALYPAADPVSLLGKTYPMYHVNVNGELMFGSSDLIKLCDSNKFVLMPPLSVIKSLSGLTLDELANIATQLKMSGLEGNKAERVAAIASFKVRSRI